MMMCVIRAGGLKKTSVPSTTCTILQTNSLVPLRDTIGQPWRLPPNLLTDFGAQSVPPRLSLRPLYHEIERAPIRALLSRRRHQASSSPQGDGPPCWCGCTLQPAYDWPHRCRKRRVHGTLPPGTDHLVPRGRAGRSRCPGARAPPAVGFFFSAVDLSCQYAFLRDGLLPLRPS